MRLRRTLVEWTETSPDDDLVAWTQRGEREAFGLLYQRHFPSVYGYCYRLLGERETAQDAAAETFRKALAALPSYQPHAFRGWLFAIARHVIADTIRARRGVRSLDEAVDVPDTGPSLEEKALAQGEMDTLIGLLSQLTPDQRDVIALRLTGLSPGDIGVVLGKSRAAVDMTLHRALRRLRALTTVGAEPGGGSRG
jgi:RNA polymerase sigma-70 factor (ECF subfamily)